jgi:hypothetical protein
LLSQLKTRQQKTKQKLGRNRDIPKTQLGFSLDQKRNNAFNSGHLVP